MDLGRTGGITRELKRVLCAAGNVEVNCRFNPKNAAWRPECI